MLLAVLWAAFCYRHVIAFQTYGVWAHLLYAIVETFFAAFFLCRSAPQTVSTKPFDWLIAFVGSVVPSFLTPEALGSPTANIILYVGLILQLLGVLSLNRSLAIVPAKRQIKMAGMYAFVRHPLYVAHIVVIGGYVFANMNASNFVVYAVTIVSLLLRLLREENHLALDPAYLNYMNKVRYRLIPFVF
jgi:protein-S-isoprenylcysteine O-methyltransferase Ste14